LNITGFQVSQFKNSGKYDFLPGKKWLWVKNSGVASVPLDGIAKISNHRFHRIHRF